MTFVIGGSAIVAVGWAGLALAQASAPATPPPAGASDPIISDSQFEEALPALDPALDAPLGSIEDTLPPLESVQTAPAVPGAPAVAEVQVDDPALAEPLPTIAGFDVAPEQPAVADTERAATIRYDVSVDGLEDVGLTRRFRDLSALTDGDGEAANGAVIAARARQDEELALRILRSEGYYDGVATSLVEPVADQPGRVRATITATPGGRYSLGSLAFPGPATTPPNLVPEAFRLQPGHPLVAADITAAEAGISLRLPQQGYPFVELGERDVLLDPATMAAAYTLPVDPGPRARFGGFTTTGDDPVFDADHVEELTRFDAGDLYDSRMVDDLRQALVATGLLSTAAVEPVRTGQLNPDGTERVDLLVRQEAGPDRRLAGAAGYGTGEGIRLEGTWTHRNLFPPEGALTVQGIAGTLQQLVGVNFLRSNAGARDRSVFLGASASRNNFEAFEAYTAAITGRISRDSTPIWQKRWTYNYGFEVIATNETVFNNVRISGDRQTYFIVALPGQLTYDRSNNLLDPTRGFRLTARLSPETSQRGGNNSQYVRALTEGSVYYPVNDALTIAARARFGFIPGIDRDELAPSRRYYAGGGGSVRGFGFQQLGPRDQDNIPIGGRSLNEFAIEGRYRFGDYGVVAFVDAGQVYDSIYPRLSDMRFGVGVGGRLYTNFGPMRVDVATPINRQPGEPTIALYISIGQAF